MISSLSNPKVKKVRRLQADKRYRSSQRLFVIEGTRWVAELANEPSLREVFYTANWHHQPGHSELIAQLQGRSYLVSESVMTAMSDTKTPPGVLAILAIHPIPIPQQPSLMLILDSITNPGNLGTMLRTAAAAGVDAVLLSPGCVDVYNPKVVRGSMGALLRLPVHELGWEAIREATIGMHIWAAAADGRRSHADIDWRKPAALIIGNEAHGVSQNAHQLAHDTVAVRMRLETESLNAAMATGIILFEAVRQRAQASSDIE